MQENFAEKSFHKATLARTLNRWGFEFGKGVRSQHLKEKDHVVAARQRYLREMRENRTPKDSTATIRPEVYLDESYVNKNHSNDFIWYYGEDGPWAQKPTGKGERLIVINAITKSGWIPGSKLVFKSTRKTGDYHGQINWELFEKWFTEMLLPNIPEHSLIIMDNAPYHNILSEHSPRTKKSSKKKIKAWLEQNKIYCRDDYLKPELQPIETCWGVVKNHVGRNCDFTVNNLVKQLDSGFNKVTAKTCAGILTKVRKIEDEFWETDIKMDA